MTSEERKRQLAIQKAQESLEYFSPRVHRIGLALLAICMLKLVAVAVLFILGHIVAATAVGVLFVLTFPLALWLVRDSTPGEGS